MRKQKGFSLIELLIVVAIILIIAAIAIPNLLRARMAANESAAASSVRTINTAEVSYITAYPTVGYSDLKSLGDGGGGAGCPAAGAASTAACLIDDNLAVGGAAATGKSGYIYAAAPAGTGNSQYVVGAAPANKGSTGTKSFCSVEDAVVRVDTTAGITQSVAHDACLAISGIAN